uniref:Putative salivary lipocalin n=1 Tax=Ixodes ricinus TaxID=34613 RepID=A0A6B0V4B1_IXORI
MFLFLCTAFVVFGCSFGKTEDQKCFPKGVEQHLRHPPNAWKLMRQFNGTFYLVYCSSEVDIKNMFPCLNVRKSSLDEGRKSAHYVYKHANTTTTLTGTKEVKTEKKDGAYKNPNMFVVQYHEDILVMRSRNQQSDILDAFILTKLGDEYKWHYIDLLYTDYISCAVLNSNFLGIQMWVSKTHLENDREVPWLCALVYDLATDQPRQVVYDWKECPQLLNVAKNN